MVFLFRTFCTFVGNFFLLWFVVELGTTKCDGFGAHMRTKLHGSIIHCYIRFTHYCYYGLSMLLMSVFSNGGE